jgi:sulfite reductase alpha subunit-like flavoprotein
MESQMDIYRLDPKRIQLEVFQKNDGSLVEAILTSLGLGLIDQIDLNELNLATLFYVLRNYLKCFSSPLFTFPFSIKFTEERPTNFNKTCKN